MSKWHVQLRKSLIQIAASCQWSYRETHLEMRNDYAGCWVFICCICILNLTRSARPLVSVTTVQSMAGSQMAPYTVVPIKALFLNQGPYYFPLDYWICMLSFAFPWQCYDHVTRLNTILIQMSPTFFVLSQLHSNDLPWLCFPQHPVVIALTVFHLVKMFWDSSCFSALLH